MWLFLYHLSCSVKGHVRNQHLVLDLFGALIDFPVQVLRMINNVKI